MDKLLLIDGYSLVHRAFYALPPLQNKDGLYTNAIYGFFNMLIKVLKDADPKYLCVALDAHAPTFRHAKYEEYKGTRKPMPEELRPQLPLLREILHEIGIAQMEMPGFEADDIIGTLSRMAEERGLETIIVTGDRDAFQLIDTNTSVWMTRKGLSETERLTPELLKETYGVTPEQVKDLKGLMGDSSDNIPGIPSVGEKTALKLLNEYETLENVLEHADEIKGKLGEKVRDNKEQAVLSKWLATIERKAPLELDLEGMVVPAMERAREPFHRLGFQSLLERMPGQGKSSFQAKKSASTWQAPEAFASIEQFKSFLTTPTEMAIFGEDASLFIAFSDGRCAICPMQGDLLNPGLDEAEVYGALKEHLQAGTKKRVFDSKALKTKLARLGIRLNGDVFDASLAAYLLRPGLGQSPAKLLAGHNLELTPGAFYDLCDELLEEIDALSMKSLYEEIELPLSDVLFHMEQEGFKVDRDALYALQDEFGAELSALQDSIYKSVGEQFNINSPKQLGVILFETLGLPASKKTKSGYSTDAEVLEGLADMHPAIPMILQFRTISKLKSTYVDGLLKLSDENGIVHTTLNQTVTVTGRISSAEPNLQNIPVRTELGRVIRKVFVPRGDENVLVDADYSQIELRVLAHMAGEENMLAAFKNGEDIHASTAAQVYGVPLSEVTSQMRSSAKAVNFGIVYGISDFGLAKNIGVSRKEAGEFIERYFQKYPSIRRFMDECVSNAKKDGFVTTLFGRRRNIPEIASSNYNTRSFGERAAMNTPIQGSAADIIKIAMVRVHKALEKEGFAARLILQVHDELIIEAPASEAKRVEELLVREMEGAAKLSVPLVADVKTGKSWFETK